MGDWIPLRPQGCYLDSVLGRPEETNPCSSEDKDQEHGGEHDLALPRS